MKLQLTIFAQDLVVKEGSSVFAVAALVGKQAQILGKTETLKNTNAPDFTKIFLLDYELGQTQTIQVSLMEGNQNIGSAIYNVGSVLGTKGGIVGKPFPNKGGFLMVHIEKSSGRGTLHLQLQGLDLQSDQEMIDPYFELQTKRRLRTKGETKEVWDVVFRSVPVMDTVDPVWTPLQLDYGMLLHPNKHNNTPKKVRIVVKDYDDREDTTIGTCLVTVPQLLQQQQLSNDAIDLDMAIPLKRNKRQVGRLVVVSAKIADTDEKQEGVEVPLSTSRATPECTDEDDIDLSAPLSSDDDDIVLLPENDNPTFVDYIAGGCQLKVVVAIDYTASNGDPRKEQSLHHFTKDGSKNDYETCIQTICSILAQYDSDQKYSVYGFGAKKGGQLSHCFAVTDSEVDGVQGILKAYKDAFQTGIAMSKPTNICQVIQKAGTDAKKALHAAMKRNGQEYTILTIFTNGNVHNVSETVKALQSVKDDPISVVVVGVGPSQFEDMGFLTDHHEKDGLRVHFVDAKAFQGDELTAKTLSPIPQQLESYFAMKEIMPNPPIESDEIVILPNSGNGFADVTVGENGDITIENATTTVSSTSSSSSSSSSSIPQPLQQVGEQGKKFVLQQVKRQFGRVRQQMTRNMNRTIDQQVNQMFGISNVTGGGRRRGGRRRR